MRTETKSGLRVVSAMYVFAGMYGAVSYWVGDLIALFTAMAIGIPAILYLILEYTIPPLFAVVAGYCTRWSIPLAIFGMPSIILAAYIFPIGGASRFLGVPVPWLAAFEESRIDVFARVSDRLPTYITVYFVAAILGLIVRWLSTRRELRESSRPPE